MLSLEPQTPRLQPRIDKVNINKIESDPLHVQRADHCCFVNAFLRIPKLIQKHALFFPQLRLSLSVVFRDFCEQINSHLSVFNLFLHIQVHCVIVGRELVPLEKLNSCLVQLQHDDLMQQAETLDIVVR